MATAGVQIILRNLRDQAAEDAEADAAGRQSSPRAADAPGSEQLGLPSGSVAVAPGTGSKRPSLDGASLGLHQSELNDRKTLIFEKNKFVERMVLEQAMLHQMPRCCIFLLQFVLLLTMVWLAYPASQILATHTALSSALTVQFPGNKDTRPEDIQTTSDLVNYLQLLGPAWQAFSPGSSAYMSDPLARTYLDQVAQFPPQHSMPSALQPTLTTAFSITAWIQTSVRYDTLVNKVQKGRAGAICWQFDLERILYGQHETSSAVQVVHPLATDIYQAGVIPDEVWKTSLIRANISDGSWHHYAVLVDQTQVTFVLDGVIQGSVPLPRPITDCTGGSMGLGSDTTTGSIFDLKFLPRVLTTVELNFIRNRGKLLSDMLAGAGMPASAETDMQSLLRQVQDTQTQMQSLVDGEIADYTLKFRRAVKTLKRSSYRRLQAEEEEWDQGGSQGAPDFVDEELRDERPERLTNDAALAAILGPMAGLASARALDATGGLTTTTSTSPAAIQSSPPSAPATAEQLAANNPATPFDMAAPLEYNPRALAGAPPPPTTQDPGPNPQDPTTTVVTSTDTSTSTMTQTETTTETETETETTTETTTTVTSSTTTSTTTTSTTTASSTTTSSTSRTTSTSSITWDNSTAQAQCLDDPNVCDNVLARWSIAYVLANNPIPDASALKQFLYCLLDHNSHLTVARLQTLPATNALIPPTGECDVLTGCVDASYWTDNQGYTCLDYLQNGWCKYGMLNFRPGEHDTSAQHACCVCGRRDQGCTNVPGWVDNSKNTCAIYELLELCDDSGWVVGPDGTSALQSCCTCRGGIPYTMVQQGKVRDRFSTPVAWTDDWNRSCTWYVSKQVCSPASGIGPGYYLSATWASYPADSKKDATTREQRRGGTAYSNCVGCGGGEVITNELVVMAGALIAASLPYAQLMLCIGKLGDSDYARGGSYSFHCPYSCGRCKIDQAPDRQAAARALLSCNDDLSYQDWLNQGCSWYRFNDPHADATSDESEIAACTRYGDSTTLSKCKRTCGTCDYSTALLDAYDLDSSKTMSADEINLVELLIHDQDYSYTISRLYVTIFAKGLCLAAGLTSASCYQQDNYPEVRFSILTGANSGLNKDLAVIAPGLLDDLVGPTGFLGLASDAAARRFDSPLLLTGTTNLALQVEDPSLNVFSECRTDADCANKYTTACGNVGATANKICTRYFQVPMYCGSSCRTGGCGAKANVLPLVAGQFCQPCDACFIEVGRVCPAWCTGYRVDSKGGFDKTEDALARAHRFSVANTTASEGLTGSFTLGGWVRNFGTQWMFERHVRIPGLNSTWKGYDPSTGMLVCWQVGATKVRFRNRWSEKALTEITNPFMSKITSDFDTWHHVVLWRSSSIDSTHSRREDLRFMVDGRLSEAPTTAWGTRDWQVPSYGFPDCGGQQLSTTLVTQNVFEGPRDFYTSSDFPEWNGAYGFDAADLTMPFAQKLGMTALTFGDVYIPKNASIKLAYLSICAARTMGDYITESTYGTSANILGTANLKIAGLLVAASDITTPSNLTANQCFLSSLAKGKARTTSEVSWSIDYQSWREKGIQQQPAQSNTTIAAPDCQVLSPDVSSIVSEQIRRLDAAGATTRDLTFVITDQSRAWGQCGATSVIQDRVAFAQSTAQNTAIPAMLQRNNQVITAAMPLWMIPLKDSRRDGASKAKLLVQYCLNEECISPTFLGAGESAVQAGATPAGRRLQEEDGPGGDEEAGKPPDEDTGVKMIYADQEPDVPHGRRLQGDCADATCTYVGSPFEPGLSTEGHLFKPIYISRAMAVSELQSEYYAGLPLLRPDAQTQLSGSSALTDRQEIEVPQYPAEVVSIIPPVIFQTRSPTVPCDQLTPGLAVSLENYFTRQIQGKCNSSYTCADDNGFMCMDRSQTLNSDKFFGVRPLTIQGTAWYAEFLDLFTVPIIYRGDVIETASWVDLQTSQVMTVNVFVTPGLQAGTILTITWSYSGPGRWTSNTNLQSFMNMSDDTRHTWAVINALIIAFACLDILILFIIVLYRWRNRRQVVAHLRRGLQERQLKAARESGAADGGDGGTKKAAPVDLTEKQEDIVTDATPFLEPSDFFDVALRVILIAFCVWHAAIYPDPKQVDVNGEKRQLQYFDEPIKLILDLQWSDPLKSTEDKVNYFMQLVVDLTERLDTEQQHRFWASLLILAFFVRIVVYMRVHPRIAILYATIIEMMADFLHFMVLFCTIYGVMAFWGNWSFGDLNPDFADYQTTLYTQFHMMIGEYNMQTGEAAGMSLTYGIYCILFFLMVFSLLLNFFLAIVIDSYSKIKDSVKDCEVENSIIWDCLTCVVYPLVATCRGWPSRERLIAGIMAADLDQDGNNDETQGADVPVTPHLLATHKLVKGQHRATALMRYYQVVCPTVNLYHEDKKAEVQHKTLYKRLVMLDEVRHQVFGQARLESQDPAAEAGKDPLLKLHEDVLNLQNTQKRELQDLKTVLLANMGKQEVQKEPTPVPPPVLSQVSPPASAGEELKDLLRDMRQESLRATRDLSGKLEEESARTAKVEQTLVKVLDLLQEKDAKILELLQLQQQRDAAATTAPGPGANGHDPAWAAAVASSSSAAPASAAPPPPPQAPPALQPEKEDAPALAAAPAPAGGGGFTAASLLQMAGLGQGFNAGGFLQGLGGGQSSSQGGQAQALTEAGAADLAEGPSPSAASTGRPQFMPKLRGKASPLAGSPPRAPPDDPESFRREV